MVKNKYNGYEWFFSGAFLDILVLVFNIEKLIYLIIFRFIFRFKINLNIINIIYLLLYLY